MFSDLDSNALLQSGDPYTFTYDSNQTFQTTWVSTVLKSIEKAIGKYAAIRVTRPMGSARFLVTVLPKGNQRIQLIQAGIESGLSNAGVTDLKFVTSEGGTTSSQPGGLVAAAKEVISETTEGVSSILWSGIKPLIPWLLVAGAGFIAWQYYSKKFMMSMVPTIGTNPRRRKRKKAK
jgi:hypothetical protein